MKSEWQACTIGELCDSVSVTYRGEDERVVLVNTSDVLNGKVLNHTDEPNQNLKGQFKKTFKKNDILYSEIRPANRRFAYIDFDETEKYIASTKLMVIRYRENVVEPRFLYFLLTSNDVIGELQRLAETRSGTFPQITFPAEVATLPVNLPPLPIQQKIASILSSLDDKIETNNAICRNLEEQARALYELWLSKRKNECEWLSLEAIADLNPEAYSIKEKWGYINYLDTGNITDGVISSIQKIDLDQDELPSRARRKVKAGDVVFSTVRPNQRHFGILHSPLPNMLVSTGFTVIRSNKTDISNELIYLLLSDSSFVEKMQQIGEQSVSAYPSVKPTDIATCQLPFMDSMDYSQMQNVICSMFAQIASLQEENRKLSNIRDSLLPKLMSREFSFNIKILH